MDAMPSEFLGLENIHYQSEKKNLFPIYSGQKIGYRFLIENEKIRGRKVRSTATV